MKQFAIPVIVLMAAVSLSGCTGSSAQEPAGEKAPSSSTWTPDDKRWGWLSFQEAVPGRPLPLQPVPGKVVPVESETWSIQAPLAGRVESVSVHVGDRVKKGQALLRIRSTMLTDLKREQALAEEALRMAEKQADHARTLAAAHAIAERELLQAQQELRQARVNLRAVNDKLAAMNVQALGDSAYLIRAPQDGVVVKSEVLPGDEAGPERSPLMVLANLDQLVIWAQVTEGDLVGIREGELAEVRSPGQPDRTVKARVITVSQAVDPEQRTVGVRLITEGPAEWLRPNGYVQVTFTRPQTRAMVVPSEAVVTDDLRSIVFVKHEDGKLERRPVSVGHQSGGQVELKAGLRAGETVVVKGAILLLNEVEP